MKDTKSPFVADLMDYLRAGYPLLYCETHEENRLISELFDLPANGFDIYCWSLAEGMLLRKIMPTGFNLESFGPATCSIKGLFDCLAGIINNKSENRKLIVLKDLHRSFSDKSPEATFVLRKMRSLCAVMPGQQTSVLLCSPVVDLPVEWQKLAVKVDLPLPSKEFIKNNLDFIFKSVTRKAKDMAPPPPEMVEKICQAAKGLTSDEIENIFALSVSRVKSFDDCFVKSVFDEKVKSIKQNSALTYVNNDFNFTKVGGHGNLKQWFKDRIRAFEPKAIEFGLKPPKGVILTGVPGTGKSLLAKAMAGEAGFPLFQLDVGAMFKSYVGDTEAMFRHMIKTVEALSPCFVLIDEIEKAFSENAVAGRSDGGVSSRSFATFLSWLNDRTSPVFIVATSNDHTILPAALKRRGRFNEIFWVDLPGEDERREILEVIMRKNGLDIYEHLTKEAVSKIISITENYSGADFDILVEDAMFLGYSLNRKPGLKEFEIAAQSIKPMAVTEAASIAEMRKKAENLRQSNSESDIAKLLNEVEEISRKIEL